MKNLTKLITIALATATLVLSGTVANATVAKPHKCGVVHVSKKPLGKKALDKKASKPQLACKSKKNKNL